MQKNITLLLRGDLVLLTGLEPVWTFGPRDFKSLASADFATTANIVEAPPRIELGMKVLQTSALPLGYGATNIVKYKDWQALIIACQRWSGKRDSNSRHLPWQGNALPLSHSRMCPALSFEATIKLWWEL